MNCDWIGTLKPLWHALSNPSNSMAQTTLHENLSITAQAVTKERLTYLSAQKLLRLEGTVLEVIDQNVCGDILEFGVALGGSAIVLAKTARAAARAFHGFDVFGLIPEPASEKDDQKSKDRYKTIASGKSAGIEGDLYYGYKKNLFQDVCASFERHGIPVDGLNVTLHKGLFQETWPRYAGASVAFAHLDCDWYEPVKFCLDSLVHRLAPGGAIILDDYNDYGGCRTAANEFVAAYSGFTIEPGANAILRRKSGPLCNLSNHLDTVLSEQQERRNF
jgi:O-methyltransferase